MLKSLQLAEDLLVEACCKIDPEPREHDLLLSSRLALSVAIELLLEKEKEVSNGE